MRPKLTSASMTAYEAATVARALSRAGLPRELVTWCQRRRQRANSHGFEHWNAGLSADVQITSPSGRTLGFVIERPMGDWIAVYQPLLPIQVEGLTPYERFANHAPSVHSSLAEAMVSVMAKAIAGI